MLAKGRTVFCEHVPESQRVPLFKFDLNQSRIGSPNLEPTAPHNGKYPADSPAAKVAAHRATKRRRDSPLPQPEQPRQIERMCGQPLHPRSQEANGRQLLHPSPPTTSLAIDQRPIHHSAIDPQLCPN